jgi:predicted GNAT family N-acyltransferase
METAIYSSNDLSKSDKDQIIALKSHCFSYTKKTSVMMWDKYDRLATHILVFNEGNEIVGYGRACAPNTFLKEASFSRICVYSSFEGVGIGKDIIAKAIELISINNKTVNIIVRRELINYYKDLGFKYISRDSINKNYYLMGKLCE